MNTTSIERIERIRERITNRSQEIQDLHEIIVNEREAEHGLTLEQAQGIMDMLLSFNRADDDLIERIWEGQAR